MIYRIRMDNNSAIYTYYDPRISSIEEFLSQKERQYRASAISNRPATKEETARFWEITRYEESAIRPE